MNIPINYDGAPYWIEYQRIKFKKNVFHRHSIEFLFVIRGELTVDLDGEIIVLNPGEFMCINAGILHMLKGKKDTYITSLYIDLDYFEEIYPFIRALNLHALYKKEDSDATEMYYVLRNYFIRLMLIEHNQVPKLKEVTTEIVKSIVDILINYIVDVGYTSKKIYELKEVDRERMLSMTAFMANNFDKQGLSLADLAAHENLSTTRLSHFWKSLANISFMDTILMYRYNEAKRLLIDSDLSVSEITQLTGISDEKYLYKAIKEKHNMTPKDFREKHKKDMKTADKYDPKNLVDIYNVILEYSSNYYYKIKDFSFMHQNKDRIEEEKNLNDLYGIITLADKYKSVSKKIESDSLILRLGLNRGLRKENKKITISWEYAYAIFQISIFMYEKAGISIDVGLMSVDEWMSVISRISEEITKKYGAEFRSISNLYITFLGYENYKKALELEEKLKDEDFYEQIQPVLYI